MALGNTLQLFVNNDASLGLRSCRKAVAGRPCSTKTRPGLFYTEQTQWRDVVSEVLGTRVIWERTCNYVRSAYGNENIPGI